MTTALLIDAAKTAKANYEAAVADLARATAARAAAQAALTTANKALHDDLAANGPACVVDTTVTPAMVTVYQAADPDTWTAEEVRVA